VGDYRDAEDHAMDARRIGALGLLGIVVAGAEVRPAQACGGTFCDAGPTAMPVDQTGENVLFVVEDGHVEAHIQIQYEGDADSFAWIVPVLAVPEVTVGSDALFQSMLQATVPTFGQGACGGGGGGGGGCGMSFAAERGEDAALDDDIDEDDPDVLVRGTAGAYEYVVLEGMNSTGVMQWLVDHDYAADQEAAPILQEYVEENFLFVAFRLRGGASIDEIHPVVLRWAGTEPCVPIRLTRIAAVEDMAIRVFFLGDERFVPTNYRHVQLNALKLDWINFGANYPEVLTLAIDSEGADGHAFVTEYAGSPEVVVQSRISDIRWSSAEFVTIEAVDVVDRLADQTLMACSLDRCDPMHPLVAPLLEDFLPTPAGMAPEEFWANLDGRLDEETIAAFSGAEFAAALEERIIGPADHAMDILDDARVLTRMVTTISPAEMTEDPLFHAASGLPSVTNVLTAELEPDCSDPERVVLPDGREVWLDDAGQMPEFADTEFADTVELVPPSGAPMILVDNRDDHHDALADWNDRQDGCGCRIGRVRLDALMFVALVLLGVRVRGRRRG
jgi:hypothetical protein